MGASSDDGSSDVGVLAFQPDEQVGSQRRAGTEQRRGLIVGLLAGAGAVTVVLWAAGLLSLADRGSVPGGRHAVVAAAALQGALRNGGAGTAGTRLNRKFSDKDEVNPAVNKTFNYEETLAAGGALPSFDALH